MENDSQKYLNQICLEQEGVGKLSTGSEGSAQFKYETLFKKKSWFFIAELPLHGEEYLQIDLNSGSLKGNFLTRLQSSGVHNEIQMAGKKLSELINFIRLPIKKCTAKKKNREKGLLLLECEHKGSSYKAKFEEDSLSITTNISKNVTLNWFFSAYEKNQFERNKMSVVNEGFFYNSELFTLTLHSRKCNKAR